MPRNPNQKLKLLYLYEILKSDSDEEHPVTVSDLIAQLQARGIRAERKSIYADLNALRLSGVEIKNRKGHSSGWFLARREFDLDELKLLVDAVRTAPFIDPLRRKALTKKLEGLTSRHHARQLQRTLYTPRRSPFPGGEVLANTDKLHSAIAAKRAVTLRYHSCAPEATAHIARCILSPYALIWDDGTYYLAACDGAGGQMELYRVDRMEDLVVTSLSREGEERFANFDPEELSPDRLKVDPQPG